LNSGSIVAQVENTPKFATTRFVASLKATIIALRFATSSTTTMTTPRFAPSLRATMEFVASLKIASLKVATIVH
jgi:hypothetical protein